MGKFNEGSSVLGGTFKAARGWSVPALVVMAALALAGCGNPAGDDGGNKDVQQGDQYEVKISPSNAAVVKGGTQAFAYALTKNGAAVSGTAAWSVAGNAKPGTAVTAQAGGATLTVAADETAAELTVTATVTYNGGTYPGSAKVTVVSKAEAVTALKAIKDAASADALLTALKDVKSGVDASLVVDANKDAYWDKRADLASILNSVSESSSESTIAYAMSQINGKLQSINFTLKTKTILEQFNSAADAAAVLALLTEANFQALELEEEWAEYNVFSAAGKTIVADSIFSSRPSDGFVPGDSSTYNSLAARIQSAISSRLYTEKDTLAKQFNNKAKDAIKPLLTKDNFILLDLGTEVWERYSALTDAQKDAFAGALENRSFGDYSVASTLKSKMTEALSTVIIEGNLSQIKTKLNAAITGTAQAADVNGLFEYITSIMGGSNAQQLQADKTAAFNTAIRKAREGKTDYTAIKAYLDAGANVATDAIKAAITEVAGIVPEVNQGITRGEMTVTGLPADTQAMGTYVRIYDETAMPASSSALSQLTAVETVSLVQGASYSNNAIIINGTTAKIIIRWSSANAAYAAATRTFLVKLDTLYSYNGGSTFNVVGLVSFTAGSANASVDFSALTDVEALGKTPVTVSNLPANTSISSITVYSSQTLPTTQDEYNALSGLIGNSLYNTPSYIDWNSSYTGAKTGSFLVKIITGNSVTKIGLATFTATSGTIDWNTMTEPSTLSASSSQ